jgi:L-threonylcarbamoyladenylate synthase
MLEPVNIADAVAALERGDLVAFPTETVYGLGADATSDRAVARVYEAKGRPLFNPLITHVASVEEARALGEFGEQAERLSRAFWPGPLTLVVPRTGDCPVSLLASAGLPTIALRVPRHPLAHHLLSAFGRPVVAPSANPSGRISPTMAAHVRTGLGERVTVILDGGPCEVGVESTVVGIFDHVPHLLRPGGISRADIEAEMGQPLRAARKSASPHSPGQLASHYAPRARLRLDAEAPRTGEIFLGFGDLTGDWNLSPSGDVVEAAANLFRMLHEIDASGPEGIAVAPVPRHGLGEAINDRLLRAAAARPD